MSFCIQIFILQKVESQRLEIATLRLRKVNLLGTVPVVNSLLEKRISFCSSLKTLSTDTSFIKIEVCCQKLSTVEFNLHYWLSSHYIIIMFVYNQNP